MPKLTLSHFEYLRIFTNIENPVIFTSICECESLSSGGASAVKEPGHFEVRKSSSQVIQIHGRSQDFTLGHKS